MEFEKTDIDGLYVISLKKIGDDRGFFARAWCEKEFDDLNLTSRMVQANTSYSKNKGTMRGIHYQEKPHQEAKLVRCTKGSIFDVAVDLRENSATYKSWYGIELSDQNKKMLYVPEGFGHGYLTLEGDTEVYYLVSEFYTPESERGVRWDDPSINIDWPIKDGLNLTDKDKSWPNIK